MGLMGKFQKKEAKADSAPKPVDEPESPGTDVSVGAEPAGPDAALDSEPVDDSAALVGDSGGEESGGEETPKEEEADDESALGDDLLSLFEAPVDAGDPRIKEMTSEIEDIDPADLVSDIVSLTGEVEDRSVSG